MKKIKHFIEGDKGKDLLTVIIVILVGLGSFELGRLSKENTSPGIKITSAQAEGYLAQNQAESTGQAASVISATKTTNPATKNFFASNRGSKYYPVGCSAGDNLKKENRIYFSTKEEAEAAGYTLSSSCY